MQGEDGIGAPAAGGFEFGVNPDDDPELALALRVSMEEQRARQQAEGGGGGAPEGGATPMATGGGAEDESSEEAMLQRALAMSMDGGAAAGAAPAAAAPARDLSSMTEEEQIAYAMQVELKTLLKITTLRQTSENIIKNHQQSSKFAKRH